ncbi:APC family permease [Anthocerotibacter panamensis]|uniref:APC family permease n=1 Tax=Anthocerotibacter panamensis TaxID=2857077 RepID=UPI001C406614|nr:APC family permease [Anthocerotibacter panamensis]
MSLYAEVKRLIIGKPLPTSASNEERLSNPAGLAVLSSDALSSVAYATEEILLVLVMAGSGALKVSLPIAAAIIALLAVIILSYRQTIKAYPKGGGAYIVARENLGIYPGLIAGASLMIDYILTVAVSITAGTAALTSAVPQLLPYKVELCVLFILVLMVANLRGLRESGRLFMLPTYAFIVSIFILIALGLFQQATGALPPPPEAPPAAESLTLFLVLRAFAAGCTALTGVEAISDGVLAFQEPEWKNARRTLLYMGLILGCMFIGITYLANVYHVIPEEGQTTVSQIGRIILGESPLYYFLQFATLLVLILAANTAFADFPRLSYFLARDGFLPRQLALLGDRLVYSNGVLALTVAAIALVLIFGGQTNALIPLYAVGVFTSFTLSQAGMVRYWLRERTPNWVSSAFINGVGAIVTGVVLGIISVTKFLGGAWLVILTVPLVVALFFSIRRHYQSVAQQLSIQGIEPKVYPPRPEVDRITHPVIVLVGALHRGTMEALDYARAIADEVVAVHVDIGTTNRTKLQEQWDRLESDIPLIILESPYRSVVEPVVDFVHQIEQRYESPHTTVVLPTFVTAHWWEGILHNQTTLLIKTALRAKKGPVVTSVQYFLQG